MDDYGFSKSARLLNAADYKAVFSNAQFRVSTRHFLILAISDNRSRPRLGLVIAKKHVPLAVHRNRIKRLTRDSFRRNSQLLANLDIVVLARKDADKLDNKQISETFTALWLELDTKLKRNAAKLLANE
ncbi:MAG: ribonuclease P protein component [SAR86 cluster bacterium]|uniref:Ribonuclease P protein component n=1 Tax=SAR86 cluster bacterium TaxID=2030880 RepID=A0A2A5AZP3_9GAMM|nr:MAG: ribonuclease P protein component [SAR86 cluster bacterium]